MATASTPAKKAAAKKTSAAREPATDPKEPNATEGTTPTEEAGKEGNQAAGSDAASVSDPDATPSSEGTEQPDRENATEVTEEEADAAEPGADPSTVDGAGADAAARTDLEQTQGAPDDSEGDEDGEEKEPELDSFQQAAIASSLDRSQMASAAQARDFAAALAPEEQPERSHSQAAVARRDRAAMDAELTAGRTTPVDVVLTGADGKKGGTAPDGSLNPVDKSGLHGPSQDALNPAFAILVE